MRSRSPNSVLQHLRQIVLRHQPDGLTDAQLLEAFLIQHEEAAFAALVRRHGPMVFGVCRRILGNRHDAEDAFQATFLVLLRKASSIRPGQAVGPWLHGVAQRTARRARETLARRRAAQKRLWERARRRANTPHAVEDWRPLLDEELSRLPEKYRAPIVLCDLQGRTHKEAARELGWPQGTLSGRLWRARALLARRLTRRGLAFSAAVLMLAHAEDASFASLVTPLIQATMKAARMVMEGGTAAAGGVSASVAALTQGVLKAMWMTKVRITAALLLTASLGTGIFLHTARMQAQPRAEEKIFIPPADFARTGADKIPEKFEDAVPTVANLVNYLNDNAKLIGKDDALKCTNLSIDCKADRQNVGLGGSMICQKPRNFRLMAKVLSQPAVDIGSNNEEFWYWISKNEPPYLFHCSYEALARGARVPFPFQPDMVITVLGIAEYDDNKKYELNVAPKANYFELIEWTTSPQGQLIQKVVVFNPKQAVPPEPQVLAYALRDEKDNNICIAHIKSVQRNRETDAILPRVVKFEWPAQKLSMTMEMNNLQVIKTDNEQAGRIFTRKNLNHQTYDSR